MKITSADHPVGTEDPKETLTDAELGMFTQFLVALASRLKAHFGMKATALEVNPLGADNGRIFRLNEHEIGIEIIVTFCFTDVVLMQAHEFAVMINTKTDKNLHVAFGSKNSAQVSWAARLIREKVRDHIFQMTKPWHDFGEINDKFE